MLAVLKADVDRLGQLFTRGLGSDRTVGRSVALSRLVDAFFTGWLTEHVRRHTPNVYTVYAGGDDLLLIGPWLTTIRLAADLRGAFRRFAGDNPDVTLSAGIELSDPKEPVVRSVARAEERLESAKRDGRDRISLILAENQSITWAEFEWALLQADRLTDEIRGGPLPTSFLYKLLWFADRKAKAEGHNRDDSAPKPEAADWAPKLAYHRRRLVDEQNIKGADLERFDAMFATLFATGSARHPRIPITLALYRNRGD
jgi:CRISPR-associated protein Csm1